MHHLSAFSEFGLLLQVRICTRLNIRLVSTPFEDKAYYTNIRKAITAGFFMQVDRASQHGGH